MSVQNIRNVCLLGHSGSGKTTLAESILFLTGATDRLGSTANGNTVCDSDPEEIRRQISLSTAVAPVDYAGCRVNILDAPGAFDFAGEVMEALWAADAAILVCSAKDGVSVGLEKSWKYCEERNMPRFLYISKTDEENSDYQGTLSAIREKYGNRIAPLAAPSPDGKAIVDLVTGKAYQTGKGGKRTECPVPDSMSAEVEDLRAALMEAAAGADEELIEKFLDTMELTPEEIQKGMSAGVLDGSVIPVLCGSAVSGLGTLMLLDSVVSMAPNPAQAAPLTAALSDEKTEEYKVDPAGPAAAFVFKTLSDQYGKYSFVKVLSGKLTPDMPVVNSRTGVSEKLGRLYSMRGKKATEIKELECGDIGAVGKMDKVKTGDTLCDPKKVVSLPAIPFAEPCYSVAIVPKVRGQEDKISQGLSRMNEEDPSFAVSSNAETHQMLLSGAGDMQIDVLVSKLKNRFNVEAELQPTRVPYREKIRKTVQKQGRHKKQTGGSGQFGCGFASSRTRTRKRWYLPRKCSAAACPGTSSPPWKRDCGKRAFMGRWPGIRW